MKEAVTAIQVWHLCDPVQVSSPPRASVVNSRIVTPQTCIPQRAWHKQQLVTDAQESKDLSVFHVSPRSFPNLMTKHWQDSVCVSRHAAHVPSLFPQRDPSPQVLTTAPPTPALPKVRLGHLATLTIQIFKPSSSYLTQIPSWGYTIFAAGDQTRFPWRI